MFENLINDLKNGFITANATRKLVLGDSQLFIYPILAIVVSLLLIIALGSVGFAATLLAYGGLHSSGNLTINIGSNFTYNSTHNATNATTAASNNSSHGILIIFILSIFVIYVLVFFVVIYFTAAMLIAFREYANGKKITVMEALKRTAPYARLLLEWAIFISTIKAIIEIINIIVESALRRYGFIGNIIARVLFSVENLALAIIGLFALPVILDEKTGPLDTMKTSAKFIIKNFGETFSGFVYSEIVQYILIAIGEIFIVAAFLTVFAGLPGGLAASAVELLIIAVVCLVVIAISTTSVGAIIVFIAFLVASTIFHVPSIGGFVVLLVGIGTTIILLGHLVKYVLFNCFKLVVYDYKTRNVLPKGFDAKLIDDSIKGKNRPKPGSPASPTPNDLNLFGSANKPAA